MQVQIHSESDDFIIVNKPAGLNADVDRAGSENVQEDISAYLRNKYPQKKNIFSQVVNRLDKPVSGLMICSKKKSILTYLNEQLSLGLINKYYLAVLEGELPQKQGTLTHITKKSTIQFKAITALSNDKKAKEAKLKFQVLGVGEGYSLVLVKLITGRYHQIRFQMSESHCPIWNDTLYGASLMSDDNRIGLSSIFISFKDKYSGNALNYFCLPSIALEPWNKFTDELLKLESDFRNKNAL